MEAKKKVLFITGGMMPFVPETPKSKMGRFLPQRIQEQGHEIRIFTPKWGIINERRNQLHEVIRLSGMNIIIDETDHPLIIKVASIPQARMQIYFIDNDDYFVKHRLKEGEEESDGFEDDGERAVFYARGVLETVKKLRWVPDVVHCHGWITSLAPLYIKKAYQDEPSFANTKVVFSVAEPEFEQDLGPRMAQCIPFKKIKAADFNDVCPGKFGYDELQKLAVKYSDAIIMDTPKVSDDVLDYAKSLSLPILPCQKEDKFPEAYSKFYNSLFED